MKNYDNLIEIYKDLETKTKKEFENSTNIRNFYCIRRPTYIFDVMLLVCILPIVVMLFGIAILYSFGLINGMLIRPTMFGVLTFCCLIIAPLYVKMQKKNFKDYDYLIKNKNKTEIMIDDCKHYYKRLFTSIKADTFRETHKLLLELKEKENKKEQLIQELQNEYEIKPLEKKSSEIDIEEHFKEYEKLTQLFKNKIEEFSVVRYFEKIFKQDIMRIFSLSLMFGVFGVMFWNLPLILMAKDGYVVSNINLLINLFMPMVIVVITPFVYNTLIKNKYKQAFEIINKELQNPININKYYEEVKQEYDSELEKIMMELVAEIAILELYSDLELNILEI